IEYAEQALTMCRELYGEVHPHIAYSLRTLGIWNSKRGEFQRAVAFFEQALSLYQKLLHDRHPSTIEVSIQLAVSLVQLNRRKEAYDLVANFKGLAQGPLKEQLKQLETKLLSKLIRPGFSQPPKSGKRKRKKKRR